MPGMDGRQLAEQVRAARPDIKVVFMSGYPDDEVLRRGVQQDQVAFLEKPFTQAKLSAKVREVLDAPLPQRGA
jgi:CheY-like chemotaxis protein